MSISEDETVGEVEEASTKQAAPEGQPFAVVRGQPVLELPQDLYIPPDALEVFLEAFEGPLDLLLYLIKRQNLDILDVPIARITDQYMEYIDLMQEMRFELAAEYLVMAATLAEIKSRMLLPRPQTEEEEEDPRAELVRRLQEYERFKRAAEDLDALPRLERDVMPAVAEVAEKQIHRSEPHVSLPDLLRAFSTVMKRAEMFQHHHIQREPLSVRERMSQVLSGVRAEDYREFATLFDVSEGRRGVVVTFLAVLELLKESLIELIQNEDFGRIYVRAAGAAPADTGGDDDGHDVEAGRPDDE